MLLQRETSVAAPAKAELLVRQQSGPDTAVAFLALSSSEAPWSLGVDRKSCRKLLVPKETLDTSAGFSLDVDVETDVSPLEKKKIWKT